MSEVTYALRSRSLVRDLSQWLAQTEPGEKKGEATTRGALLQDHPRVKNLAGLLRRNGLLQTVLFLQTKGAGKTAGARKEELLWRLLEQQLGKGLQFTAAELAKLDTPRYLFLNERAIEVAILLSRLLDAQALEKP